MAEEIIIKVDGLQELKNIEATFKTFVTSINAAVTAIGAAGGTNSLSGAIGKVTAETKKHSQAIDENKVKQQQLNAIEKERIIASSEYSKATEKLLAQTKILQREIDSLVKSGQTESALYREKSAQLTKMTQEYDRLQKATGLAQMKQTGMYGATYQLSQVMRELPNFAIDARIGFLSLSNNLPMLIDSFKQLSMEIDSVTGKPKGFKGAMEAFGKSLLSLNTAFVAVTILFTLFGDKIVKAIGNLFNFNSELDKTRKLLTEIDKEAFGSMQSELERIMKLSIDYYSAVKRGDDEKIKSIEVIAQKEYGVHKDRLVQIGQNVNSWRNAFDLYLEKARETYRNEAIIKKKTEAELNLELARIEKENIIKRQKDKLVAEGYSEESAIRTATTMFEKGTGVMKGRNEIVERWNSAVEAVRLTNNLIVKHTQYLTKEVTDKGRKAIKDAADTGFIKDELIKELKQPDKSFEQQLSEAWGKMITESFKQTLAEKEAEKGISILKNSIGEEISDAQTNKDILEQQKEATLQSQLETLNALGSVTDSIAGLYDARIQKMNDYYDMEAARIEGSTMSEEQKNEALKRLDEKRYQEELKLFEQRKKFQIATVWIDAAAGIMNAWTTKSTTPSPWDVIERVAKSAAIVAMAVTQTANINAQKPNAPKSISSGGSATGMTATQKVMSPQKTAMTSSEENLNMMLSNKEKVTSVVKVSEINNVQNRVAVRENNQMY